MTIGDQTEPKKIAPPSPADDFRRVPDYVSFKQFDDSTSTCLVEVRDDGFAFLDLEWEPHSIDQHLIKGVPAKARKRLCPDSRSLTWNELIVGYHEQTIGPNHNDRHVYSMESLDDKSKLWELKETLAQAIRLYMRGLDWHVEVFAGTHSYGA